MLPGVENLVETMEALLARHERVALQFSGGKDSMAALFLLRPWLERITVYWLNTGDSFPETLSTIEATREQVDIPHFVEINSDARAWREQNGDPSDIVPTFSTPLARLMGFGELKVSDRFDCCWSNVMRPMYERMKADGVTLIIRGTKAVDMPNLPVRSGQTVEGVEFFLPLEAWTHDDVLAYLAKVGAPLHSCYEDGFHGVDCMHCTAWWNEGHFRFLKKNHPQTFKVVFDRVASIAGAVDKHLTDLTSLADLGAQK
jgi:3'-phosphoadenosine 5'-phosphosulfate sulfotransferase (PAPS reductase)/FAD synthetase